MVLKIVPRYTRTALRDEWERFWPDHAQLLRVWLRNKDRAAFVKDLWNVIRGKF